MPKSVRKAVAECIADATDLGIHGLEQAEQYVQDMFDSGKRGGEESW